MNETNSSKKENGEKTTALTNLRDVRIVEGNKFWKTGIVDVTIDARPTSGDTYKLESGRNPETKADDPWYDTVGLSRNSYDRLATASGATILVRRTDDRLNSDVVSHEGIAVVNGPTGNIQLARAESEMRIQDFEEEVKLALEKETREAGGLRVKKVERDAQGNIVRWSNSGKPKAKWYEIPPESDEYEYEFERRLRSRVNQRRANMAAHNETRCRKRVTRALLGIAGTYKRVALYRRPIPVTVYMLNTEEVLKDPVLKEAAGKQLLSGVTDIFSTILENMKGEEAKELPSGSTIQINPPPLPQHVDAIPASVDREPTDSSQLPAKTAEKESETTHLSPHPEAKKSQPKAEPFVNNDELRKAFFATLGDWNIPTEEAYAILGVSSMKDFEGTMEDALEKIQASLNTQNGDGKEEEAPLPPEERSTLNLTSPPDNWQPSTDVPFE